MIELNFEQQQMVSGGLVTTMPVPGLPPIFLVPPPLYTNMPIPGFNGPWPSIE